MDTLQGPYLKLGLGLAKIGLAQIRTFGVILRRVQRPSNASDSNLGKLTDRGYDDSTAIVPGNANIDDSTLLTRKGL